MFAAVRFICREYSPLLFCAFSGSMFAIASFLFSWRYWTVGNGKAARSGTAMSFETPVTTWSLMQQTIGCYKNTIAFDLS